MTDQNWKWSIKDLKLLHNILHTTPSDNINAIHRQLRHKTKDQIESLITKIKNRCDGRANKNIEAPIQSWLTMVTQLIYREETDQSENLSRAVSLIGEYEEFQDDEDFRPDYQLIYHYLAEVLRGKEALPILPAVESAIVLDLMNGLVDVLNNKNLAVHQKILQWKYKLFNMKTDINNKHFQLELYQKAFSNDFSDLLRSKATSIPGQSTEASGSGQSTETTEPGQSTETTEPGQSTSATEPGLATAATEPGPATAATEAGQLTATTEPGQSTAATEPGQSTGTTEPGESTGTTEPGPLTVVTVPGPSTAATEPGPLLAATEPGQSTEATEPGPSTAATGTGQSTAATEPGPSTAATEPGQSTEAADPSPSTEATESGQSTETAKRDPSTETTEPGQPTETAEPGQSTAATEQGQPTAATALTDPVYSEQRGQKRKIDEMESVQSCSSTQVNFDDTTHLDNLENSEVRVRSRPDSDDNEEEETKKPFVKPKLFSLNPFCIPVPLLKLTDLKKRRDSCEKE